MAVAHAAEEAERRRLVETRPAELKAPTGAEKRLGLGVGEQLDHEHEKRLHAEAKTRGAQATIGAEEGLRRTEEARAGRLGEVHRHLPCSPPAAAAAAAAVAILAFAPAFICRTIGSTRNV